MDKNDTIVTACEKVRRNACRFLSQEEIKCEVVYKSRTFFKLLLCI